MNNIPPVFSHLFIAREPLLHSEKFVQSNMSFGSVHIHIPEFYILLLGLVRVVCKSRALILINMYRYKTHIPRDLVC